MSNKKLSKNPVIKVLSTLPPKSLIWFKLVCKDWSNLIINSNFVLKNLLHESIVNSDAQYSQDANPHFILIKTQESIDSPKQLYSFHSFDTLKCSYHTSLHLPLRTSPFFSIETCLYQKLNIVACCWGLICLYDFLEKKKKGDVCLEPSKADSWTSPFFCHSIRWSHQYRGALCFFRHGPSNKWIQSFESNLWSWHILHECLSSSGAV